MNRYWHSSYDFNQKIIDYHNKFARQPNVAKAKAELKLLKEEIKEQMNAQGLFCCKDFSYKGSTYEGVKIIKSDADCPEFDLDFIVRGGEFLVASASENGWHELKLRQGISHNLSILDKAQVSGTISPDRVKQLFYGSLTKCEFITKYNVKLRYHGPAVQLDVHHQDTNKLWFQVDLAPAFYLKGTHPYEKYTDCYIAKSSDYESLQGMWYRSYSTDEKKTMRKASGQRKVVLRTLKAMRGHSAQLSGLQSYHLKMAFFDVMDQFPNDLQWAHYNTGQRLIDVLIYIHKCLDEDSGRNFNKFRLSDEARTNLRNQIYRLIVNENIMDDFLDIKSRHLSIAYNNARDNANNIINAIDFFFNSEIFINLIPIIAIIFGKICELLFDYFKLW